MTEVSVSGKRPDRVTLCEFRIELHGPAELSADEVDRQQRRVEAELNRAAVTLRSEGLQLSPAW